MRRSGWPIGFASLCAAALLSQAAPQAAPLDARAQDLSLRSLAPVARVGDAAKPPDGKGSAQEATDRNAPAIAEPQLPPDVEDAPVIIAPAGGKAVGIDSAPGTPARTTPSPAQERSIAAPAESTQKEAAPPEPASAAPAPVASEAVRSDPEAVVVGEFFAGAAPNDIAAAIAALPPAEGGKGPLAGPRNWAATRDAIERFYSLRGDMPVFTDAKGFNAAGKAVIAGLDRADEDGLDPSALAVPDAQEAIEAPAKLAEREISLAEAIAVYAFQASGGRVEPSRVSSLITAKAAVIDAGRALETVAAADDPAAALAAFNPPQKGYRDLRESLAKLRAAYPQAASSPYFHPSKRQDGASGYGAPLIHPRFDLADAKAGAGRPVRIAAANVRRTSPISEARPDPSIEQALAGRGPRALEAAILANMEMWRWEPRDMGEERIEVNVADFSLRVLRGDETLHRARIIVGKPDTPTPIFSNAMRYILVNPSWRVPRSIIRKEMLPKLAKDPDYLTRLGFEVTQHGDTIDVMQPPGERNALGRIAFMFPNEHSVYLHDTPSRSLFMASRRAFSHGCVRVDQPMRLAELVMGGSWSEQRFRSLIGGGSERTLFLPHPLPIHIEYFTAFMNEAGDLQMREDLYGHMRRLESALGLDAQS
jgi:murein L,D-transpeptidase YcbB/YkuD